MARSIAPEIQEAFMYYVGRRLLNEVLEKAVRATRAEDWYGDTGCFSRAEETFDEIWKEALERGAELSAAASIAVGAAVLAGTRIEEGRLGRVWVTPVRRHIKEHWREAPVLGDALIRDIASLSSICDTFAVLFERDIGQALPERLLAKDYS